MDEFGQWLMMPVSCREIQSLYARVLSDLRTQYKDMNPVHWDYFESQRLQVDTVHAVLFMSLVWLDTFFAHCVRTSHEVSIRAIQRFVADEMTPLLRGALAVADPVMGLSVAHRKAQRAKARIKSGRGAESSKTKDEEDPVMWLIRDTRFPTHRHFVWELRTRYLTRWNPYGQFKPTTATPLSS